MTNRLSVNPAHHRHSIRLKGYDYSRAGAVFITICTHQRKPLFGAILNGDMKINECGQIVLDQWEKIPERFENVELDVFTIMPNHIHGILIIHEPVDPKSEPPVGAGFTPALSAPVAQSQPGQPQGLPLRGTYDAGPPVGAGFTPALSATNAHPQSGQPRRVTVGDVVGAYKSLVANECLKCYKSRNEFMAKLWQRNYYEHIIRDEKSYRTITEYIINNPAEWEQDQLFIEV